MWRWTPISPRPDSLCPTQTPFESPGSGDDVVFGHGYPCGEAPCIGRWSWLAAGLPQTVPVFQLDRRCGSGLQAIIEAAMMVQTGAADVVVAGGAESMSNVDRKSTRLNSSH